MIITHTLAHQHHPKEPKGYLNLQASQGVFEPNKQ